MKFGDFLNNRIDEKLGNLNASSNIKYRLLLSAILKNKYWRGLNGPNSPVVEVSGKGRTQLIKDLNKLVPKFGIPQILFLTTGEDSYSVKSNMIRFDTPTLLDTKVGLNSATFDVGIKRKYDESAGTDINVVDVERSVATAKGNIVPKRLKYSLDDAGLDDNNTYKAIVIFPDPNNINKDYNRTQNKYNDDKYLKDPFSGKTDFMVSAELNAERLKKVKHRIFKTSSMTMKDAHRMLALTGDDADNIIIDGEMFIKNYNIYKDAKVFVNTQSGIMYLCQLIPRAYNNKKWQKDVVLTYNMKSDKFELDEDNFSFNFYD